MKRRDFLKGMMLPGLLPLAQPPPLFRLVEVMFHESVAQAAGATAEINYLSIGMFGGPSRWTFDQFLKTSVNDAIVGNPMVVTRFNGGTPSYVTFDYKGAQVPHLWSTQVTSGTGAQRSITSLLDHMVVFRGYGSGVDGHTGNVYRQYNPLEGVGSLSGIIADQGQSLIRAAQYPSSLQTYTGFKSPKGVGLTSISSHAATQNPMKSLLYPFQTPSGIEATNALRQKYSSLVSSAVDAIKSSFRGRGISSMHLDYDAAIQRISAATEDLDAAWFPLYNKYLNILTSTFKSRTAVGISDQALIVADPTGALGASGPISGDAVIARYSVTKNGPLYPTPGTDIRDWVNNIDLRQNAMALAFAEFVFTRKLVTTLEIEFGLPQNLSGQFSRDVNTIFSAPQTLSIPMLFDHHDDGAMASLYLNSCLYRSLAAGLAELVDRLKAAGTFGRTVIHLVSEFSRTPRSQGNGADHGFNAMVSSLFTGLNGAGPVVVGNIMRDASSITPGYSGTYGYRASTRLYGNDILLGPGHVASSIVSLLKLPANPFANTSPPLLGHDGTRIVPFAEAVLK